MVINLTELECFEGLARLGLLSKDGEKRLIELRENIE